MMFTLVGLILVATDFHTITVFDPPESPQFLQKIFAATCDEDGTLYALDAGQKKVFVWHRNGTFDRSFGGPGLGPGEFLNPVQIYVRDAVYVWDQGKIHTFAKDGRYLRSIPVAVLMPKRFLADGDSFLLGYREMERGAVFALFQKISAADGRRIAEIRRFENTAFLAVEYGEGNAEIHAFMADPDLQATPDGFYYGFGEEPILYKSKRAGEVIETFTFDIPTQPPNEKEKQQYLDMSFPDQNGRLSLRDMPNLHVHFDRPKAYWTQFTIKENRVLFIRTAIGSLDSIGDGYAAGDYFINDLDSGRLLKTGSFAFPEDSQVYLREGRVIVALATEEETDLCLVQLDGF